MGGRTVSSCFECRITGGTIACGPESLACQWFDPERLPSDLMPISRIRISDTLAREVSASLRKAGGLVGGDRRESPV